MNTYQTNKNIQPKKLEFLTVNEDEIKKNIKENEKKRKETFIDHKVLKDEAWPWMTWQ